MNTEKERFASEIVNCAYREGIFHLWLTIKMKNIAISDFLITNKLYRVVVYGYGKVGKLLCQELLGEKSIELVAVIDQKTSEKKDNINLISPEAHLPEHDILISTIADTNYVRNIYVGYSNNIVGFDELLRGFGI